MRTNVSLWWILTGFFALVAIAYTVWSVIWYGNLEWVGTVALFFTALMGALIGFYTGAVHRAQGGELPEDVRLSVGGEQEDQQQSATFLGGAFLVAILLMTLILVVQFNSFYQTLLVLSAIVFSTAGVLIGLLVNQQSFGIVMVGMGIITLAGIVVNNNIVLIDTYNQHLGEGYSPYEAALETGCLRLRPVLLTALTTILGLMPMVLGVNVNLLEPSLGIGAPSTQWWTQLSSAIAGGLAFATLLTLILTPCMLVLGANVHSWIQRRTA